MDHNKPILLVEDGHAAPPTVGTVLDELGIRHDTVSASNSAEALAYLQETPLGEPSVILVDSSSGQPQVVDLVRVVKQHERLKNIPVIALTSSGEAGAVNQSFDLGAAGYVVKPSDYDQLVEAIRAIHQYWTLSKVPADV